MPRARLLDARRMRGDRERMLEEAVRLAERTLGHQLAAMGVVQQKNEQSILRGLALLGPGPGLVALAAGRPPASADPALLAGLGLAAVLNLAALVDLVLTGSAASSDLSVGPSLHWPREKSQDETWLLEETWLSILAAAPGYVDENRRRMEHAVRRRRVGVLLPVAAAAVYAGDLVYIIVKVVLA